MSVIPNIQAAAQAMNSITSNVASQTAQAMQSTGTLGSALDASSSPAYAMPFSGVLREAVAKTQELNSEAANTVDGLLSGKGVDIHTAMIATEKSELAFEMMLSLRNKAVGAYQQLMGMQF
ncbi:MAG TPA: flagellar hook-basal body complex protein FliE [Acidobacteriaceae bacterium]|jgi:flagellar hook-basal body complex protein FliE|nr:flagellar hook-basal body complex protein FliE [Acidobacteriaceae bacterium]